ncbi:MAG: ATP-grasp domain-containing protein [Planctomycetaceae bacterium]|nr:ATP-grasp domain-containing protein [Planctomycetaceae bacterium]
MNILLTSIGRRGYLVKYFKEALAGRGKVWGADNSRFAPAFAYCDGTVILPEVRNNGYTQALLDFCSDKKIDIVVPLIDPELEILAGLNDAFAAQNIMLLLSPKETIELSSDKYLTYQFAVRSGLASPFVCLAVDDAMAQIDAKAVTWPLLVKPRKGSASANITYCYDRLQLEAAVESVPLPFIQEYIEGPEFGYDLFGDRDFRPISVFCKKKLAMRAGETDKALTTADPVMLEFGRRLLASIKLFGPADVDVIRGPNGPRLLEINPRFGGGYPCSHLAGADFCQKILRMRNGEPLTPDIGSCPDGICMLKQDEIIRPTWLD